MSVHALQQLQILRHDPDSVQTLSIGYDTPSRDSPIRRFQPINTVQSSRNTNRSTSVCAQGIISNTFSGNGSCRPTRAPTRYPWCFSLASWEKWVSRDPKMGIRRCRTHTKLIKISFPNDRRSESLHFGDNSGFIRRGEII
ncbi:hypothetical protein WICPIJ_006979 [Wickerhamomyces pijperi]|uniref:Uncharacterized protein n=1 Tax=Wickerhamomyces pijperi TaxID=599730 RepID=A0A9P8Q394_WICPI|nr:hypothetical protein WICPIJ_006979 [Wickerhamomyces pijperi]